METTFYITLTQVTCPKCGGVYALSQQYLNEAADLGHFKQTWTCPYCKAERGYGEGEVDRLKKQVSSAEATAKWHKNRAEEAAKSADHFRSSRDAMKGVVTKIKKRVRHGVCPCCKRTFTDLARHMDSKHPKFAEPNP